MKDEGARLPNADEIRIGLVGCGSISEEHLNAIDAVAGVRLVAVASASEDRARTVGEKWGVPWSTDVDALIARHDVDAVAIATPSGLHAPMALAAVRAGKDVLVEKPLAITVEEADRVISEAERLQRVLAVISQRRFEPAVLALREAVREGALGNICLISARSINFREQSYYDRADWRGTHAMDGGVLKNQAIHEIDLLCWLGGAVSSVVGHVATVGHAIEVEDTATVSVRFETGALGEVTATTSARPGFDPEISVYGDAGHVRIVGDQAVEWDVPGMAAPAACASPNGHESHYRDFVEAISTGRHPQVTGDDARAALAVVEAAYESSRTGERIHMTKRVNALVPK